MRTARRRVLWGIIAALIIAGEAQASLGVSPNRAVLQLKPGKGGGGFFTLFNQGSEPLDITVESEDWAGGIQGSRNAVSWLRVRPKHLTLPPGASRRVKYTVRVPKDASGELRAQIFFSMQGAGSATGMRSRLGTILYVGVDGTEEIAGSLGTVEAAYSVSTPGATAPDRLDLRLGVHNRGNAHIVPEGSVAVRDEHGRLVATLTLKPGWGLLPGQADSYQLIGQGVHLQPGRYALDLAIVCGGDLGQPVTLTKQVAMDIGQDWNVTIHELPPP